MLDGIKIKLNNVLLDCTSITTAKKLIKNIVARIEKYQEENNLLSSLHSTMRTVEEHNTYYLATLREFEAEPPENMNKRTWLIQEMVTLLNVIISCLSTTLRRHGSVETDDKSQVAKNMRKLKQSLDDYKETRMSWLSMLKSQTTLNNMHIEEIKSHYLKVDTE